MAGSEISNDMSQKKKNELLLLVSYHYDVFSVQELLAAGADVNYQDTWTGHTPLFANFTKLMRSPKRYELNLTTGKITQTLGNYSQVFNLLVENGAQVNVVDAKKVSPLEYAVKGNDPLIVETLLNIGADVNTTDKRGNPLLSLILDLEPKRKVSRSESFEHEIGPGLIDQGEMHVSWVHRSDQRVMNLFIDYGANVNKPNRTGITPLMKAVALCGRRDLSYYQRILQDGYLSLKHLTSIKDRGVVRLAVLNSDTYPWILKSLLNFTLRHRQLEIPLHELIRNNVDEAVRLLEDCGSDILAFAIKSDNMDLFKMLLKSGEMPEISHWIPNCSFLPIAFTMDIPVSPLFLAFWMQSPVYIKTLLDFRFLNSFDLKTPSSLLLRLKSRMMTDKKCSETVKLYHDFYRTPRTLMNLSFVTVSMGVGFHSNRRDRVSQTMLPLQLQRMLMFGAEESGKAMIKPSADEDESDNGDELLSSDFDFDISDNYDDLSD